MNESNFHILSSDSFLLVYIGNANSPSLYGFVLGAQFLSQNYSTKPLQVDVSYTTKLELGAALTLKTHLESQLFPCIQSRYLS